MRIFDASASAAALPQNRSLPSGATATVAMQPDPNTGNMELAFNIQGVTPSALKLYRRAEGRDDWALVAELPGNAVGYSDNGTSPAGPLEPYVVYSYRLSVAYDPNAIPTIPLLTP